MRMGKYWFICLACMMTFLSLTVGADEQFHSQPSIKSITESKTPNYFWNTITYKEPGDIIVRYPQIYCYPKVRVQERVNGIIKDTAFGDLLKGTYTPGIPQYYEVTYSMYLCNSDIISIRFDTAFLGGPAASHPLFSCDTLNFNLNNGALINISDVYSIDNTFVRAILKPEYTDTPQDTLELAFNLNDLSESLLGNWVNVLKNDDSALTDAHVFFEQDNLGIIINTLHVGGNYVTFRVPYKNLKSFEKPK